MITLSATVAIVCVVIGVFLLCLAASNVYGTFKSRQIKLAIWAFVFLLIAILAYFGYIFQIT